MLHLGHFVAFALVMLLAGCAGQPRAGSESTARSSETASPASNDGASVERGAEPVGSAGGPQPPQGAARVLTRDELVGEWVEYWALAGRADTQRYLFAADGSYVWRSTQDKAAARSGSWSLDGTTLVLTQEGGERLELPLGSCPPNREAEQLDASYRCLGIGQRAFWRRDAQP